MLAQKITNPALGPALQGKTGLGFFQTLLPNLIGLAFVAGAIIFLFVMIVGAIGWIASGGDKAAIESARGKIMNAVIGLVILLSVFAFIKVIQDFFGISILALDIGPLQIQ